MNERAPAFAMLGAGVISTAVLVSLPVLAAGMATQVGGGDRALGILASADMAGSALASLAVLPFIGRIKWRLLAWGAMLAVVIGNALSAQASVLWTLAAARAFTGCGSGAIVALTFVGLCHSGDPDRHFGIYVLAQLVLQVALMWEFPVAIAAGGMWVVYAVLAGLTAASAILVRYFPRDADHAGIAAAPAHASATRRMRLAGTIGLVALAAYFTAAGAVWSYLEPIGAEFGLDTAAVGRTLAGAAFAGMAGSLLVVVLAARFGRQACLAAGTIATIAAVLLLADGGATARFTVAAALFTFAWNFTFPYQMGMLAQFDRSGEIAVTSLVIQLFALAAGPLLVAAAYPGAGHAIILLTGAAGFLASFGLFAAGARLAAPR